MLFVQRHEVPQLLDQRVAHFAHKRDLQEHIWGSSIECRVASKSSVEYCGEGSGLHTSSRSNDGRAGMGRRMNCSPSSG
jgi:hypothetical protein